VVIIYQFNHVLHYCLSIDPYLVSSNKDLIKCRQKVEHIKKYLEWMKLGTDDHKSSINSLLEKIETLEWSLFKRQFKPLTAKVIQHQRIGSPGNSSVWRVMLKDSFFSSERGPFASKEISIAHREDSKLRRELALLWYLSESPFRQYFIGFIGWKMDNHYMSIFMEFADYDLMHWITLFSKKTNEESKQQILIDIANGIQVLHMLGLSHRDLKPQNILIKIEDKHIRTKICDFETARQAVTGPNKTLNLFTQGYAAPEQEYSGLDVNASTSMQKIDNWAFGMLIFVVFSSMEPKKEKPEAGNNEFPTLQYVKKNMNQLIPPLWQSIMFNCLKENPTDRISMEELLLSLFSNTNPNK